MNSKEKKKINPKINNWQQDQTLSAIELDSNQINFCERIDFLMKQHETLREDETLKKNVKLFKMKPSNMFEGAIFAIRKETFSNLERLAHFGVSLRGIIEPFETTKNKPPKEFPEFVSKKTTFENQKKINDMYGKLCGFVHHDPKVDDPKDKINFNVFINNFIEVMKLLILQQTDFYKIIDSFVLQRDNKEVENYRNIINFNFASRSYFYTKIDENWILFLIKEKFLNFKQIKDKDSQDYFHYTPEFLYLNKIVKKKSKEVADIIRKKTITKNDFDYKLINRFLVLSSSLSDQDLSDIVIKIEKEKWIQINDFRNIGRLYRDIFDSLKKYKKYEDLLKLADSVIVFKTKADVNFNPTGYKPTIQFYLNLSQINVFKHLIDMKNKYQENSLKILCNKLSEIFKVKTTKTDETSNFEYLSEFYFNDFDFFSSDFKSLDSFYNNENQNILGIIIAIQKITKNLIKKHQQTHEFINHIFEEYFKTLPNCKFLWQLQLYILSLCPIVFQNQLKNVFSSIFKAFNNNKNYYEIQSGTAYKKTLKKVFDVFDSVYKRRFVSNVFKYFGDSQINENISNKQIGSEILSSICIFLTVKEKTKYKKIFGKKCDSNFVPEIESKMITGNIKSNSPVTQEDLNKLTVPKIVEKLKKDWSPEVLNKQNISQYSFESFVYINADGLGSELEKNISGRLNDYLINANLFFERDVLDEHYTNSFFVGVNKAIQKENFQFKAVDLKKIIDLMIDILKSGEAKEFNSTRKKTNFSEGFLKNWVIVHYSINDILKEILSKEKTKKFFINLPIFRNKLFQIIKYLFSFPGPEFKIEETEKSNDFYSSGINNLFSIALNSVKGYAFKRFIDFVEADSKQKNDSFKINNDIKIFYKQFLKNEKNGAIMHMAGYYLHFFYFLDKNWVVKILPQIFPKVKKNTPDQFLYFATWLGFLTFHIFQSGTFFNKEFNKLYFRISKEETSKYKNIQKKCESLNAEHAALAFVRYKEKFDFKSKFFIKIWEDKNINMRVSFLKSIGDMYILNDGGLEKAPPKIKEEVKELLMKLWEWVLNRKEDKEVFEIFGNWINLDRFFFKPEWLAKKIKETLKQTNGAISIDYHLNYKIDKLVEVVPEEVLEIATLYLWDKAIRKTRKGFYLTDAWEKTFEILYKNPKIKEETRKLIGDLAQRNWPVFSSLLNLINKKETE